MMHLRIGHAQMHMSKRDARFVVRRKLRERGLRNQERGRNQ